jgi:ribosomal-protein-alanine N-acetyltransferase
MSALPNVPDDAELRSAPMTLADLDAVVALEQAVYPFPWTRGNFVDSLAAGHVTQLLRTASGALQAYSVALPGVEEMHLLNLTVAPPAQGQGLARRLLDTLAARCRLERRAALWLEVRESNQRARRIYQRYGFEPVSVRRGYYPAAGRREDAVVMRLAIVQEGGDALD